MVNNRLEPSAADAAFIQDSTIVDGNTLKSILKAHGVEHINIGLLIEECALYQMRLSKEGRGLKLQLLRVTQTDQEKVVADQVASYKTMTTIFIATVATAAEVAGALVGGGAGAAVGALGKGATYIGQFKDKGEEAARVHLSYLNQADNGLIDDHKRGIQDDKQTIDSSLHAIQKKDDNEYQAKRAMVTNG